MNNLLSINAYHYVRGGADAVYFAHAELFEKHGWRNRFSSMHHDRNLACPDAEFFADNIDYADKGNPWKAAGDALRIIYSLEAKRKISALLDRYPADIAHLHNIYHHQSPSILVELKRRGVATVMTAHDLKLVCPNNKMMNATGVCERCRGRRVWNAARHRCVKGSLVASSLIAVESAVHQWLGLYTRHLDRIVAPSQFYRDKLIEWGIAPDQVVHIPNFIALPPEMPWRRPQDFLLYFGRLASEKGVATLIRAAAQSGVRTVIAGTGPEETALRVLATKAKAPVEFVGFLSGDALWSLVENARAIILPSEWYENGPMSVLEAFARGKPLIGARIGGIPELIEEGVTGWSFVSGDAADLASKMAGAMALDDEELATMAIAVQSYVRREHAPDTYYRRMASLYRNIAGQHTGA